MLDKFLYIVYDFDTLEVFWCGIDSDTALKQAKIFNSDGYNVKILAKPMYEICDGVVFDFDYRSSSRINDEGE